jgi:hypothetical protein
VRVSLRIDALPDTPRKRLCVLLLAESPAEVRDLEHVAWTLEGRAELVTLAGETTGLRLWPGQRELTAAQKYEGAI